MFELDFWDRVGLIILAASLLILFAICMICKLTPSCCLHKNCPLRAKYGDDETMSLRSSIYTEYSPMPLSGKHLKESHPQFWGPLGNVVEYEDHGSDKEEYGGIGGYSPKLLEHHDTTDYEEIKRGSLEFSVRFDEEKMRLVIFIKQAKDLPKKIIGGPCDMCIMVQLLGKFSKRTRKKQRLTREQLLNNIVLETKTKPHKRLTDTKLEDTVEINITKEQVKNHTLRLISCEYDKYSRMEITGEVLIPLWEYDIIGDEPVSLAQPLQEPPEDPKGELLFSLSQLPTAEKLSIVIMKARELRIPDQKDMNGLYARISMIHRSRSLVRKKTSVRPIEINPTFNETLVFDIPAKHMPHVVLVMILVATSKTEIDEPTHAAGPSEIELGRVLIGQELFGEAHTHWNEMIHSPRKAVANWHKLK